jgi:hypothetical protein
VPRQRHKELLAASPIILQSNSWGVDMRQENENPGQDQLALEGQTTPVRHRRRHHAVPRRADRSAEEQATTFFAGLALGAVIGMTAAYLL